MKQGIASAELGNVARLFALVLGLGYVLAGAAGFAVTGFTGFVADTNEDLLSFDLNIFHNIVHLTIGAGLVLVSRAKNVSVTQGVLIGVGLFYLLATVLGFVNYLQIISIDGNLASDNFLHMVSGGAALIFGLIGVSQQDDSRASGTPAAAGGPKSIEERRALWDRKGETYREETY